MELDNNTSSQYVRMTGVINQTNRVQSVPSPITAPSSQFSLSKRSTSIESRFKDNKLSGAPDQCLDITLRDFCISAKNHILTNQECSELIVSCLEGVTLEFYIRETDTYSPYEML